MSMILFAKNVSTPFLGFVEAKKVREWSRSTFLFSLKDAPTVTLVVIKPALR